jgi:hypothetical protein
MQLLGAISGYPLQSLIPKSRDQRISTTIRAKKDRVMKLHHNSIISSHTTNYNSLSIRLTTFLIVLINCFANGLTYAFFAKRKL